MPSEIFFSNQSFEILLHHASGIYEEHRQKIVWCRNCSGNKHRFIERNCGGVEFWMDQASIEFVGVVVVHHVTLSNCCNRSQCGYGFNSTVARMSPKLPSHQFPFWFM